MKNSSFDDFIFENKNKSYGAYVLRQNYNSNLSKGILITIPIFVFLALSPKLYSFIFKKEIVPVEIWKEIFLYSSEIEIPVKKVIHQEIKKEVKSIPKTKPEIKYTAVEVVRNDDPQPEKAPPTVEELQQNTTSTTTKAGDSDGIEIQTDSGEKNFNVTGNTFIPVENENTLYHYTDEMPSFPNGQAAMIRYLQNNVRYPLMAAENSIEGRVVVNFIVTKTGDIRNIKLIRGIGGGCDEEAIRVIARMPKWNPGKNHGTPVNVTFTLPIVFKLR
jgi:periplasmic protein TonB